MSTMRLTVLWIAAALSGAAANGGTLRIALLADTQVQGDTILLANFFPPLAPQSLRSVANTVSLGAAPQSGCIRRFSRDFVAAAMQDAGLSPERFLLPETLTAHRVGRLLTRDDAFAAIQAALARNQNAQVPEFHLEDVALESAIEVPQGDTALEVTQMSLDPALHRARFRLWSHAARGTLPFFVTARIPSGDTKPAISPAVSAAAFMAAPSPAAGPVLVDPRKLAQLHLHSQNSDMVLPVRPLQRGHLDETIRVRLPASGRTLQARVIAINYLDATF